MSGTNIGDADSQRHILGKGDGDQTEGTGGGSSRPSLPTHLRHADPLCGPYRAGTYLMGGSAPLSVRDAQALNQYYGYRPPSDLPPSTDELGAFLANIDPRRNRSFYSFMNGEKGFKWAHKTLMAYENWGDQNTMGIGFADISRAFGFPGANNLDLIRTLTRWCEVHPRTREVLDAAVETLLVEGRIPRNIGEQS